jgi:hypothetical protein
VATSITTIRETAKLEIVELGGKEWELPHLMDRGTVAKMREISP